MSYLQVRDELLVAALGHVYVAACCCLIGRDRDRDRAIERERLWALSLSLSSSFLSHRAARAAGAPTRRLCASGCCCCDVDCGGSSELGCGVVLGERERGRKAGAGAGQEQGGDDDASERERESARGPRRALFPPPFLRLILFLCSPQTLAFVFRSSARARYRCANRNIAETKERRRVAENKNRSSSLSRCRR
jgi:hypothetical protein